VKVLTIGFTKKSAQQFFEMLRASGAKRIVDVRLSNRSQLALFLQGARDARRFPMSRHGSAAVSIQILAMLVMLGKHRKTKKQSFLLGLEEPSSATRRHNCSSSVHLHRVFSARPSARREKAFGFPREGPAGSRCIQRSRSPIPRAASTVTGVCCVVAPLATLRGSRAQRSAAWSGRSGEVRTTDFVLPAIENRDSDPSGGSQVGASIGKATCERPTFAEPTDAYEPLFECDALVAQDDVCGS
jgi:hypothetical protein